jgi:hypothetical protein
VITATLPSRRMWLAVCGDMAQLLQLVIRASGHRTR